MGAQKFAKSSPMSAESRFKKAVWLIKNGPKQEDSSTEHKLNFYKFFKQVGPLHRTPPPHAKAASAPTAPITPPPPPCMPPNRISTPRRPPPRPLCAAGSLGGPGRQVCGLRQWRRGHCPLLRAPS